MPDMSSPEYLTTDWIKELKWKAKELRREARLKTALAEQMEELSWEFEKRIDEHAKWSSAPSEPSSTPGGSKP